MIFLVFIIPIIIGIMNSQTDDIPPPPPCPPRLQRSIREDIWQDAINNVAREGFNGEARAIVRIKTAWTSQAETIFYLKDDTKLGFPSYVLSENQTNYIKENGFLVIETIQPCTGYTYYIVYKEIGRGPVPVIRMSRQVEEKDEMAVEKISLWYRRMKHRRIILLLWEILTPLYFHPSARGGKKAIKALEEFNVEQAYERKGGC